MSIHRLDAVAHGECHGARTTAAVLESFMHLVQKKDRPYFKAILDYIRMNTLRITPFLPKKRKDGRKGGRRNTSQTAAPPEFPPFHRNPDGSYEGFVDAETANKLLKEMYSRGTECAVRAFQKKDEAVRQEIEANKRKEQMT